MQRKVHIVVVTYNRCDLLKECLEALLNQNYDNFMIYLINNASTDGTEEMIQKEFLHPKIRYFNTGDNLGGAGGFQYGMMRAGEDECDYIWLMDDDTIVSSDALQQLLKCAVSLNDDFGFLSSYVEFTDGTPCKMNIQTLYDDPKKLKREWIYSYDAEKEGHIIRISSATFVSYFIRKKVVDDVGLPIKEFFIWSDDTEYSLRISKDYKCYFCFDSRVTHKMKENAASTVYNFINGEPDRIQRYFYAYRNRFYIAKKQSVRKVFLYVGKVVKANFQILFLAKTGKLLKLGILWKGFIKGLTFNPTITHLSEVKSDDHS